MKRHRDDELNNSHVKQESRKKPKLTHCQSYKNLVDDKTPAQNSNNDTKKELEENLGSQTTSSSSSSSSKTNEIDEGKSLFQKIWEIDFELLTKIHSKTTIPSVASGSRMPFSDNEILYLLCLYRQRINLSKEIRSRLIFAKETSHDKQVPHIKGNLCRTTRIGDKSDFITGTIAMCHGRAAEYFYGVGWQCTKTKKIYNVLSEFLFNIANYSIMEVDFICHNEKIRYIWNDAHGIYKIT